MHYFKSYSRILGISLIFSLSLYSMEQELKRNLLENKWVWDEKNIKKIANNSRLLSVCDVSGNTALSHLLDTITYYDTPHPRFPHFIVRTYSYPPHLLLKIIKKSDLTIKNNEGQTALDLLLEKIGNGIFHTIQLFGDYYVFKYESQAIGNKLCMAQSLLLKLMDAAQHSGYDFIQNKQTKIQLLGQDLSSDLIPVVKRLLLMGIPLDGIEDFCKDKIFLRCLQNYDYETIQNNKEFKNSFNDVFDGLQKSNNSEDRSFFSDMFIRLIAQNHKKGLKFFGDSYPNFFSPLQALEYALEYNSYAAIPFILRSFRKTTLINLSAKIRSQRVPYASSGYDQKLYVLFKKAKKKGQETSWKALQNYAHAVAALTHVKKSSKSAILGIVRDIILEYVV